MTVNALLLFMVLATVSRTQTLFTSRNAEIFFRSVGSFILLCIPVAALFVDTPMSGGWKIYFYNIGFALSFVLLVTRVGKWENYWPVILLWPTLLLIDSQDILGQWLAMIIGEFLLLFAYQKMDPRSDYYKYGLLKMLVVFQFFVFENLFFQARPLYAGEFLALLLVGLYLLSLFKIIKRMKFSEALSWIMALVYIQYGVMVFDRLLRSLLIIS